MPKPRNSRTVLGTCRHCEQGYARSWLERHRGLCAACWGTMGVRQHYPIRRPAAGPCFRASYVPTADEIRAACAAIQTTWDERDENARRVAAYRALPMVFQERRLMGA